MKKMIISVLMTLLVLPVFNLMGCQQVQEPSEATRGSRTEVADERTDANDDAPTDGLRVTFIDVGKGDCVLLQNGGEAALIDVGFPETADKVTSTLREQGVERLSFAILTHYDKDHVGGIRPLGETFSIDAVYLPGYEGGDKHYRSTVGAVADLGLAAQDVTKPTPLKLGEARLTIYPSTVTFVPGTNGDEGNDNDLSLVTSLTFGKDSYLFAGDLEKEGIDAYLQSPLGHFDVLKMPHHGQAEGNSDDFLESVQPSIAVMTDSTKDPSDKKIFKLLKKLGVEGYCTSDCGTIVVESDGAGSYDVTTDR